MKKKKRRPIETLLKALEADLFASTGEPEIKVGPLIKGAPLEVEDLSHVLDAVLYASPGAGKMLGLKEMLEMEDWRDAGSGIARKIKKKKREKTADKLHDPHFMDELKKL